MGDGHLKVFFRDRRMENIYVADSWDNGLTWSRPRRTKLPNNNASIQANKLKKSAFNASIATSGQGLVIVFDNTNREPGPVLASVPLDRPALTTVDQRPCCGGARHLRLQGLHAPDAALHRPIIRRRDHVALRERLGVREPLSRAGTPAAQQLSSRHSRPSLKSVSRSCRPARAAWRPGPRSYGVLVPHRLQAADGLLHVSHSYNRDTIK